MYAHIVEPVTHMLTGACLSRALGFPARARYATAACVIAAELPDADYVYRLSGPLVYFQHHRGWTHAFWSLPLQAAFVVLLFVGVHRTRKMRKRRRPVHEPAPVNWLALCGMALLALCSHILLDWTNNYGVRPFAPWNPRWYAGEFTFIVEPLLLLALAGALLLPLIFSLVHREIGVRRARYSGQGLAVAALVCMTALWTYRVTQRADAGTLVQAQEWGGRRVLNTSINPYPVNPFRWHVLVETPLNFQAGEADTRTSVLDTDAQQVISKRPETLYTLAAKRSWLGQVYLNWSRFPVVREVGMATELHPELDLSPADAKLHVVRFSDLRFRYNVIGLHGSSDPPLSAEAWLDDAGHVRRIFFGGAEQRLR